MSKLDTITIEQAIAALTAAARRDFPSAEAQLKAQGLGIAGYCANQARQPPDPPNVSPAAPCKSGTLIPPEHFANP